MVKLDGAVKVVDTIRTVSAKTRMEDLQIIHFLEAIRERLEKADRR